MEKKEEVIKNKNRPSKKIEDFLEKRHVVIQLTQDFLGTVPKDKKVWSSHIQAKVKDLSPEEAEEELTTIQEVEEKGWTGFHADEQGIFIYHYMLKGFLKTAAETLQDIGMIPKIVAYKKRIDNFVFIYPRRIRFTNGNGGVIAQEDDTVTGDEINKKLQGIIEKPDSDLERPLRTMTRQGPRVTVAKSDVVKAGRTLSFDIALLPSRKGFDWVDIEECFDYGRYNGLGQWRASGGYGTFDITEFQNL